MYMYICITLSLLRNVQEQKLQCFAEKHGEASITTVYDSQKPSCIAYILLLSVYYQLSSVYLLYIYIIKIHK